MIARVSMQMRDWRRTTGRDEAWSEDILERYRVQLGVIQCVRMTGAKWYTNEVADGDDDGTLRVVADEESSTRITMRGNAQRTCCP